MISESVINNVKDIAVRAGVAIMEIYKDESKFKVEQKSDDSPLTAADQAANAVIVAGLEKLDVSFPIISEENKLVDYEIRKNYERFWLVDPLDGTKEFIKRNGEFTVNIALIEDQEPIFGVVYVPATVETYWGVKGEGSWYSDGIKTNKLDTTRYSKDQQGVRVVCSRSHINEETQQLMAGLNQPEIVSRGSSLKFLIIAKGDAELYPRIGPTMEWDTAAAHIVLTEAGGTVTEYQSDGPLLYNKENLLNPYFIASAAQS